VPKSNGPSGSGDEPPRLSKPAPSAEPPASSAPGATPSGPDGDTKPGEAKAGESKAENKANVPASDSGANGGNRPRLRRGKPAESFSDEDVPIQQAWEKSATADLSASGRHPGRYAMIPAISDVGGPDITRLSFSG
jgi:hypothetical protein